MKKSITIIIVFLTLFFADTHPAKANFLDDIGEYLSGLVKMTFAPKYKISPIGNQQTTDYTSINSGGYAKRVIPEALNNQMKLQYLADYVKSPSDYKNIDLATCPGASSSVSLSQLAAYAITHYGLPLDQTTTDNFLSNNKTPLNGNSACFDQIFDNFYNTPQGSDTETVNSELTNTIIKIPIPDTKIVNSESKSIDNSKKNLNVLHRNLVPDQADPNLSSARAESLYENFLIPENEQK